MTPFLYNPPTHQWNINFVKAALVLSQPAFGEFKDGRGEFIDQEFFQGRSILVRAVSPEITVDGRRFEQFFSRDGQVLGAQLRRAAEARPLEQSAAVFPSAGEGRSIARLPVSLISADGCQGGAPGRWPSSPGL
jgi:hypothetical protein